MKKALIFSLALFCFCDTATNPASTVEREELVGTWESIQTDNSTTIDTTGTRICTTTTYRKNGHQLTLSPDSCFFTDYSDTSTGTSCYDTATGIVTMGGPSIGISLCQAGSWTLEGETLHLSFREFELNFTDSELIFRYALTDDVLHLTNDSLSLALPLKEE